MGLISELCVYSERSRLNGNAHTETPVAVDSGRLAIYNVDSTMLESFFERESRLWYFQKSMTRVISESEATMPQAGVSTPAEEGSPGSDRNPLMSIVMNQSEHPRLDASWPMEVVREPSVSIQRHFLLLQMPKCASSLDQSQLPHHCSGIFSPLTQRPDCEPK